MMKICFFCKIDNKDDLYLVEFYHQDIEILKKIDPYLSIATKYTEIDWSADVIFIWWWTYAFFPIVISKILRKKSVITGTFNYRCPQAHRDYFRRPWWQRLLIRFSTKYANQNVFVSENEYNEIRSDWKYNNLKYIPHCINLNKYSGNFDRVATNDLFTICWTGKENIKRKCLIEIIDAIDILRKKNKDIHLNIAGHQGEAFEEVKNYIDKKQLNRNISLLGRISENDKIKYLQNCSCYLQPSKYEGFGLAIAEAMSCGAVVISNSVGEVPNVVGDAGVLISTPSPENIAAAVEKVLSLNICEIGRKARNRISLKYSMERREKELTRVINQFRK